MKTPRNWVSSDGRWELGQVCEAINVAGFNAFSAGIAWAMAYPELLSRLQREDTDDRALKAMAEVFATLQSDQVYLAVITNTDAVVSVDEVEKRVTDTALARLGDSW